MIRLVLTQAYVFYSKHCGNRLELPNVSHVLVSICWLLFTANLLLTNILSYEAVNSNIRRLMERICLANWSLLTPESAWQPPGQRGVQVAVNSNENFSLYDGANAELIGNS